MAQEDRTEFHQWLDIAGQSGALSLETGGTVGGQAGGTEVKKLGGVMAEAHGELRLDCRVGCEVDAMIEGYRRDKLKRPKPRRAPPAGKCHLPSQRLIATPTSQKAPQYQPAEHLKLPALTLGTNAPAGLQGIQASMARAARVRNGKSRRDQSLYQRGIKPHFYTAIETHRLRYRITADPSATIPQGYDPPAERERRAQADQASQKLAGDMKFNGARGCLDPR